jgi:hypothetical protein
MQNEMKVPQDQALLFGHNPENQEDFPLFGRKWGKNEDWVTAMVNWVQEKTKNPKFDYLTHKITTRAKICLEKLPIENAIKLCDDASEERKDRDESETCRQFLGRHWNEKSLK